MAAVVLPPMAGAVAAVVAVVGRALVAVAVGVGAGAGGGGAGAARGPPGSQDPQASSLRSEPSGLLFSWPRTVRGYRCSICPPAPSSPESW